jgi:hypothetical protein
MEQTQMICDIKQEMKTTVLLTPLILLVETEK